MQQGLNFLKRIFKDTATCSVFKCGQEPHQLQTMMEDSGFLRIACIPGMDAFAVYSSLRASKPRRSMWDDCEGAGADEFLVLLPLEIHEPDPFVASMERSQSLSGFPASPGFRFRNQRSASFDIRCTYAPVCVLLSILPCVLLRRCT